MTPCVCPSVGWHQRQPARWGGISWGGKVAQLALLTLIGPSRMAAQDGSAVSTPPGTPGAAAVLVFDGATVVDVETGRLRSDRRVVIVGNRIRTVGARRTVALPPGAQVIKATGQYLIPGLWDLHTHPRSPASYLAYVAMGVTGIRRLQTDVRLDSLVQWRREILAGRRVGPPRQILSGPALNESQDSTSMWCRNRENANKEYYFCTNALTRAPQVVDSLQAAGTDMLKMYDLSPSLYFTVAAEARRRSLLFGGHITNVSAIDASDSGARIIDHLFPPDREAGESGGLAAFCYNQQATVASCRAVAERFRRNDTWWVPTAFLSLVATETDRGVGGLSQPVIAYGTRLYQQGMATVWTSGLFKGAANWLRDSVSGLVVSSPAATGSPAPVPAPTPPTADSLARRRGLLAIVERVGLPIIAGTDDALDMYGWVLHLELAAYVREGVSPLHALQSATLNPAKLLHATDSLGTIAAGKLADLVLLDANPLADITNTTTIRAVVANGRYFDRAALDSLVTEVGKGP